VRIRWAPGHTGIEGNEAADKLADQGALQDWDADSKPTVSGIKSIFRDLRRQAQSSWWAKCHTKLSTQYKKWGLDYRVRPLPELDLKRSTLHRLLAIRTAHGDFCWYHQKFAHGDAKLTCSCGHLKDPEHLVRCRKVARTFSRWPQPPYAPPSDRREGLEYLQRLMAAPADFAKFLEVTEFYSRICTR
jgi:hypothetical protein